MFHDLGMAAFNNTVGFVLRKSQTKKVQEESKKKTKKDRCKDVNFCWST